MWLKHNYSLPLSSLRTHFEANERADNGPITPGRSKLRAVQRGNINLRYKTQEVLILI